MELRISVRPEGASVASCLEGHNSKRTSSILMPLWSDTVNYFDERWGAFSGDEVFQQGALVAKGMNMIAGDIGGTKTRLGLFEAGDTTLVKLVEKTYASADYASLDEIVARFIFEVGEKSRDAAFAIAGPVSGRTARTTNLPWHIDAAEMERRLGFARVRLLNDLEAVAYGIAELGDDDFATLNSGKSGATGHRGVIAAGTGLGMAGLYWDGARHRPFPSEGGHAEFAPNAELQVALYQYIAQKFGHVSKEKVLSGPGLVNIFSFILATTKTPEPARFSAAKKEKDPAAAIAHEATAGSSSLAAQALDMFVDIYGSEAGNLALTLLAKGGVYIGGGIAPKIIESLKKPAFMDAFLAKGRMKDVLADMPVKVILNDRAALFGAARVAMLESP